MWYIHPTGYYSALKNEILIHATTCMKLENIIFHEISQSQILHDSAYMKYLK